MFSSKGWPLYVRVAMVALAWPTITIAADSAVVQAEKLLKAGLELSRNTHYLEALDLLDEAAMLLQSVGITETPIMGDVLYALAETKIKGRLHQRFPAGYVKAALKEIQASNRIRERLSDVLPQTLARGYYLEGFIQKRFFRRFPEASACFVKAVQVDPHCTAAKRELSELIEPEESK